MKVAERQAAQGDVLFKRVEDLPEGCKKLDLMEDGNIVVAHSETGHHHVVPGGPQVAFFAHPTNPRRNYLVMEPGVPMLPVQHLRSFDTHTSFGLKGGESRTIWEVRRQREKSPAGWETVKD